MGGIFDGVKLLDSTSTNNPPPASGGNPFDEVKLLTDTTPSKNPFDSIQLLGPNGAISPEPPPPVENHSYFRDLFSGAVDSLAAKIDQKQQINESDLPDWANTFNKISSNIVHAVASGIAKTDGTLLDLLTLADGHPKALLDIIKTGASDTKHMIGGIIHDTPIALGAVIQQELDRTLAADLAQRGNPGYKPEDVKPYEFTPEEKQALIATKELVWDGLIAPWTTQLASGVAGYQLDPFIGTSFGFGQGQNIGEEVGTPLSIKDRSDLIQNGASFYLSAGIGKVVGEYITSGKALNNVAKVVGTKNIEELRNIFARDVLDAKTLHKVAATLAEPSRLTKWTAGLSEGITVGAGIGVLGGHSAEESFRNGMAYGIFGAVASGLHMPAGKGSMEMPLMTGDILYDHIKNNALASVDALKKLPPIPAALAEAAYIDGVPLDHAVLNQLPIGQNAVVRGLKEVTTETRDNPHAEVFKHEDGTYSVLISKPKPEVTYTPAPEALAKTIKKTYVDELSYLPNGTPGLTIEHSTTGPGTFYDPNDPVTSGIPQNNRVDIVSRGADGKANGSLSYEFDPVEPTKIKIGALSATSTKAAYDLVKYLLDQNVTHIDAGAVTPDSKKLIENRLKKVAEPVSAEDRAKFKTTGYLNDQAVVYRGEEYRVVSSDKSRVNIQDPKTLEVKTVKRRKLQDSPNFEKILVDPKSGLINYKPIDKSSINSITSPQNVTDARSILAKDPEGAKLLKEIDQNEAKAIELGNAQAELDTFRAAALGWKVETGSAGNVIISNDVSGKVMATVSSIKEAAEFIDNYTQATSVSPAGPGAGRLLPVMDNKALGLPADNSDIKLTWLQKKLASLRQKGSVIMNSVDYYKSVSNLLINKDIRVLEHFYGLENAETLASSRQAYYYPKVNDIAKLLIGEPLDRRSLIFHAFESMTKEEIETKLLSRPMNYHELQVAKSSILGLDNVDGIRRVREYQLKKTLLNKAYQDPIKVRTKLNTWEKNQLRGGPLTLGEKSLLAQLEVGNTFGLDNFSEYAVTRWMEAALYDTPTRSEFMANHKFTNNMRVAMDKIEAYYKELGDELGIKDIQKLHGYISHFRVMTDQINLNSLSAWKELRKSDKAFFNDMTRVGSITDLITDPIDILTKYTSRGIQDKYLAEAQSKFKDEVLNTINILRQGGKFKAAAALEQYTSHYLAALKSAVPTGADLAKATMDMYLKKLAPKANDITRGHALKALLNELNPWAIENNNFLKTINIATQGLRPIAGIRDAYGAIQTAFLVLGPEAFGRGIENFGTAVKNAKVLQETGKLPGISNTIVESANEQVIREAIEAAGGNLHVAKAIINNLTEKAFATSLQPQVYRIGQALTYYAIFPHALENINQFRKGLISWESLSRELNLNKYQPTTQLSFREIIKEGDTRRAAELLATEAGYKVMGRYGKANAPKYMWTKYGKLAGQFAYWPTWFVNMYADEVARGVLPAAKMAAYTYMSYKALNAAQQETGMNLQSWIYSPTQALTQWFGPDYQDNKSPFVQLALNTGQYMIAKGNGNDDAATDAINDLMGMIDPKSGVLIPVPLMLRGNMLEAMGQMDAGAPIEDIGFLLGGGTLDSRIIPRATDRRVFDAVSLGGDTALKSPLAVNQADAKDKLRQIPLAAFIPKSSAEEIQGSPKLSKSLLSQIDTKKFIGLGAAIGMIKPYRVGIELEFHIPYNDRANIAAMRKSGIMENLVDNGPGNDAFYAKSALIKRYNQLHDEIGFAQEEQRKALAEKYFAQFSNDAYESSGKKEKFALIRENAGVVEITYGPFRPEYMDLEGLKTRLDWLKQFTQIDGTPITILKTNEANGVMFRVTSQGTGAQHIHVSPKPAPDVPISSPFILPKPYKAVIGDVRYGRYYPTIEYRNMIATYDINEIVDNINKAYKHTKEMNESPRKIAQ